VVGGTRTAGGSFCLARHAGSWFAAPVRAMERYRWQR